MSISNYVKVGRAVIAAFDDTDLPSTQAAYEAAVAASGGRPARLAFFKRPAVSGPWDSCQVIGFEHEFAATSAHEAA